MILGNGANVGIGVSAPNYQLHLSTDEAGKLGSPLWKVTSDRRLKKDITDFTDGISILKQIRPVWFSYNGEAGIKSDKRFVGILAQEMQKIAPYTIGKFTYEDSVGAKTDYLDYDANAVTYMLINSVKEHQEILERKEIKIQQQATEIGELTARLAKLEELVSGALGLNAHGFLPLENTGESSSPSVVLEQNAPNSFTEDTAIKFTIPVSVKSAAIHVYAVDGVKVGTYPISERGHGQLKLSANTFHSGVYLYDLVTDGKSSGTKKMVITR